MKINPPHGSSRAASASGKTLRPSKASKTGKAFSLDKPSTPPKTSDATEASATTKASRSAAVETTPTMPRALQDLEQQRKRIDKLLAQAASGRNFSPQQLLKLQATVYRYGQDLEVLSRVVDKTVGALKQTLNTQV
ncbi:MAG: hypothetical protein CSA65_03230 [Proteobacteria bacterium]|nr:MAG: hypothetical protein CSA65_03230 [Pseudomonadota bacterium]